jgi:hypothetical protein
MGLMIFDDKGVAWNANSPRLADALHSSIRGEALADYAVKNLGFVAAEAIHASARIRIRPAIVSQGAHTALSHWLLDCAYDRILISSFEGNWSHRLVQSRADVVAFLGSYRPNLACCRLDNPRTP